MRRFNLAMYQVMFYKIGNAILPNEVNNFPMARQLNPAITRFIVENVDAHSADIASLVATEFGVTRATATNYLHRLMDQGLLRANGKTRARTYALRDLVIDGGNVLITPATQDDEIWSNLVRPKMAGLPENIIDICGYGFTEMFNNVIDHSESPECYWTYQQNAKRLILGITDRGVGVYEKIRRECNLDDDRQALLELSKGKLTSDPARHTGEGIFFTSRSFDLFTLTSHHLAYARQMTDDEQWLLDITRPNEYVIGTTVTMSIDTSSTRTLAEVFAKYQNDDLGFSKTHLHVALAKVGDDQLISRSQAKRLMSRIDKFSEVILDFDNVASIGQGFADEIFRVFQREHPDIHIAAVRTNAEVRNVITHVRATAAVNPGPADGDDRQPTLL